MEGVTIPPGYKVEVVTDPSAKSYDYDTYVKLYRRGRKFRVVPSWVLVSTERRDLRMYSDFDERIRGVVSRMIEAELRREAFAKKSAVYYGGS